MSTEVKVAVPGSVILSKTYYEYKKKLVYHIISKVACYSHTLA